MAVKKKSKSSQTVKIFPTDPKDLPAKDDEEIFLEKLVFGDAEGFENNLKQIDNLFDNNDNDDDNTNGSKNLFFYDSSSDEENDKDEFLNGMKESGENQNSDDEDEGEDNSNNKEDESDDDSDNELENVEDDKLFFVDESDDEDKMDVDGDSDSDDEDSDKENDDADAWYDSDDENITISLISNDKLKKLRKKETDDSISGNSYIRRLRNQFERIYPKPEWANKFEEDEEDRVKDSDDDENEDDEDEENVKNKDNDDVVSSSNPLIQFLKTNKSLNVDSKQLKLIPANKIDISRLTDANIKHPSRAAIQTISFHKDHPLLITGGYDRSLRIYHIDGKTNNVVTTLFLKKSPIQSAYFNDNFVFAGGRRRFMYKWDIFNGSIEKISRLYGHEQTQRSFENFKISKDGLFIGLMGNSGWINLLNAKTGQWVKGFKIEGTLIDFDFIGENKDLQLIACNVAGEVWEWEVNSEKIISRWKDESGVGITKIRVGGVNGINKNRFIAIGNNVGIVNVYDRLKASSASNSNEIRKPIGTVENLVTTISTIEFSPDGQIMCIASRDKKDALRLVHLPTCKVYSNWPTSGTPLGKVTAVCFSHGGEMLCTGNEAGKVRLWRLNHY
ncbi:hypothetical protein B5S31_g2364 [[Candida] boidinii]|nr:hypothetical protein B5S29_g3001 [[Candida] boidinii]OWB72647.1 hypothetical protein B5S31_g2364 [[Candida] boidinii]